MVPAIIYGVRNKYNTPLLMPAAAVEPPSKDVSALALHMAHCALASTAVNVTAIKNKLAANQFFMLLK